MLCHYQTHNVSLRQKCTLYSKTVMICQCIPEDIRVWPGYPPGLLNNLQSHTTVSYQHINAFESWHWIKAITIRGQKNNRHAQSKSEVSREKPGTYK